LGNHTIDCKFCGEDQRLGFPCCEQARKKKEADDQESRRKFITAHNFLMAYGLHSYDYSGAGGLGSVSARDVYDLLKKFEGKVLKPTKKVVTRKCAVKGCKEEITTTRKTDKYCFNHEPDCF
jgi:hypothetical protein